MKKKKINRKLALGKKQISNLASVQGGLALSHHTCFCEPTIVFNCTWLSELRTQCECIPTQNVECPSWGIICPVPSKDVCEA
ncbi:class I lanthipeptide [uncultured Kordia sp.]|uniref:class I lanthipeptide n=1 Tax=uncultured Kordia sp. TaxID=507699 RepID=UPI002608F5C6|nr:class I lanthipeptide [uncultured Kordia sp.]